MGFSIEGVHPEERLLFCDCLGWKTGCVRRCLGKKGREVGRGHILMAVDAIRSSNHIRRHDGDIRMPSAASYVKLQLEWLTW